MATVMATVMATGPATDTDMDTVMVPVRKARMTDPASSDNQKRTAEFDSAVLFHFLNWSIAQVSSAQLYWVMYSPKNPGFPVSRKLM